MKFFLFKVLIVIITLPLFAQNETSFKLYKDQVNGKVTAYSDGIFFRCQDYSSLIWNGVNGSAVSGVKEFICSKLYPKYSNSQFTLILENSGAETYTHDSKDFKFPSCEGGQLQFGTNGGSYCIIYLTIKLNNDVILILPGRGDDGGTGSFPKFKFNLNSKQIKSICESNSIKLKFSNEKPETFEQFDFIFTDSDLNGFKEFSEGMKKIGTGN